MENGTCLAFYIQKMLAEQTGAGFHLTSTAIRVEGERKGEVS